MFTTYDLQQFLNGIATLFQWGYWGTMLLMLVILVPIAFLKGESHNRQIWNAIGASAWIVLLFVQINPHAADNGICTQQSRTASSRSGIQTAM